MHLQNGEAPIEIGTLHGDLAIESAGTQECGIENVRAVRRGNQDHAAGHIEAVHFNEHLIQGLLTFVVASAETGATMATHRVNLIDEDDRRRIVLGLLEQVTHTRGTHAHEHLDKVRPGDRIEGNSRFARNGTREKCLSGSWRAVQKHTLRDFRTDRLELCRLRQELLDLLEFLHRFIGSGDIRERRLRHVFGHDLRLGLTELHQA